MNTIMHATLSASGSPSEVQKRIADQVQAAGEASPEQAQALGAARTFIDKAVTGVSEDDTLSVNATVTISVMPAPPVVLAKRQAQIEEVDALKRQLKAAADDLQAAKDALAAATAPKVEAKDAIVPVTQS